MMSQQEKTFERVYDTNVKKLYKFFYFKVLDKQTAEDLTSETFVAMAEKISSLTGDDTFMTRYLYGIARNKWNTYLKDKYKKQEILIDDETDFVQYVEDEVDTILGMTLRKRAITFINMLPPKQRVVATMRLIDGLTPTQIAGKIKKTLNYVKVTLRRAYRRLEELVAASRVAEDSGGGHG